MLTLLTLLIALQIMGMLGVDAAIVTSSLTSDMKLATDAFMAATLVERLAPIDDTDDNGITLSHSAIHAIIVALILFLVLIIALYAFRKHRSRRLINRLNGRQGTPSWVHSRNISFSDTARPVTSRDSSATSTMLKNHQIQVPYPVKFNDQGSMRGGGHGWH